jgi:hypothetical protein
MENLEDIEDILNTLARPDFYVKWVYIIIFVDDSVNSRFFKLFLYLFFLERE